MKKRKLAFLAVAIIAVALLLETGILKYVNDRNTYRMAKVLLDRVVTVLNKNDESEDELIQSLKDDYIVRAKAVSYIIDAKPEVDRWCFSRENLLQHHFPAAEAHHHDKCGIRCTFLLFLPEVPLLH